MIPINTNRYKDTLLDFANLGLRYVVGCIDPSREPNYAGYATFEEANAAANELEEHSAYLFSVIELVQLDGEWCTDFEDQRFS
jgi:hypothetical protein